MKGAEHDVRLFSGRHKASGPQFIVQHGLDNRLARDVQPFGLLVQRVEHPGGYVHIDASGVAFTGRPVDVSADDKSRYGVMSSLPSSNRRSNSSAVKVSFMFFIKRFLRCSGTTNRYDARVFASKGDNRRPVTFPDFPDHNVPGLAGAVHGNHQRSFIIPQLPRFLKIHAMLDFVGSALVRVVFKLHDFGIILIPYRVKKGAAQ